VIVDRYGLSKTVADHPELDYFDGES
jgi:hypothetical protein